MCTLGCKNCNKNNIYLGTSTQNFESIIEMGDFDDVVFTDCVLKARESAYEKTMLGKDGVVYAHSKSEIGMARMEDISDDDYGYQLFVTKPNANLFNFVAV